MSAGVKSGIVLVIERFDGENFDAQGIQADRSCHLTLKRVR